MLRLVKKSVCTHALALPVKASVLRLIYQRRHFCFLSGVRVLNDARRKEGSAPVELFADE